MPRRDRSWWQETLRDVRRASWTLKLIVGGIAIMVLLPLFSAIDAAAPHRIRQRGGVWVCDLRAMGDFDLDQVHGRTEDIPRQFRDLDSRRVELVGQMWAPYRASGRVRDFDLVYSIANCCFSGAPKVQHLVKATVLGGRSVDYCPGRVDVKGTLHVGVRADADGIESVYRLDVDSATPD
jgi:hypothetical protein